MGLVALRTSVDVSMGWKLLARSVIGTGLSIVLVVMRIIGWRRVCMLRIVFVCGINKAHAHFLITYLFIFLTEIKVF